MTTVASAEAEVAGELNVLCAGAVKGLVLALQGGFERATGLRLHATFGAVGAMRDALRSGAPCDVFIATDAMIGSLQASGELRAAHAARDRPRADGDRGQGVGAAAGDRQRRVAQGHPARRQRDLLPRRDLVDRRRARRRDPRAARHPRRARVAPAHVRQRRDRDARARRRRRAARSAARRRPRSATRRAWRWSVRCRRRSRWPRSTAPPSPTRRATTKARCRFIDLLAGAASAELAPRRRIRRSGRRAVD